MSAPATMGLPDALQAVLRELRSVGETQVPVAEAAGRVLSRDLCAVESSPAFPCAAMDGFALHAADLDAATETRALRVTAEALAGHPADASVEPGAVVRIATGALVPAGTASVVPVEAVVESEGSVLPRDVIATGLHVRQPGDDIAAGQVLRTAGSVFDAHDAMAAAAQGIDRVWVAARVRVHILATGDELTAPAGRAGAPPTGRVRDCNTAFLAARCRELGAEVECAAPVRDDATAIAAAVGDALRDCDMLLVTGGASVGQRDLTRDALLDAGVVFSVDGVRVRPGRPVAFGTRGSTAVFALPGRPRAVAMLSEVLVAPALRSMLGQTATHTAVARLSAEVSKREGVTQVVPARVERRGDGLWAECVLRKRPAVDTARVQPNAVAVLPETPKALRAGASVNILLRHPPDDAVRRVPQLGFVGHSNSGKTTLVAEVVARLHREGWAVGVVKHAHRFQMDREGKDSWRFAQAGARAVAVAAAASRATLVFGGDCDELASALASLPPDLDAILVEGYKLEALPKIEVNRDGTWLCEAGKIDQVVATVGEGEPSGGRPHFAASDLDAITDWVRDRLGLKP